MSILTNTHVRFSKPVGDELLFQHMHGSEELGKPFLYELTFFSKNSNLSPKDLLGQTLTIELDLPQSLMLPSGGHRYFNGYVARMALFGRHRSYYTYTATVRPWLWLLSKTQDCRIFQCKSVPEIIKDVFRKHGLTDFEEALTESYAPREYVGPVPRDRSRLRYPADGPGGDLLFLQARAHKACPRHG